MSVHLAKYMFLHVLTRCFLGVVQRQAAPESPGQLVRMQSLGPSLRRTRELIFHNHCSVRATGEAGLCGPSTPFSTCTGVSFVARQHLHRMAEL